MLAVHQISKAYHLQPVLAEVSFSVNPGERVGLIGPNGCGKSSLLRTIAGQLQPVHGYLRLGAKIRLGHMAQEQESLDPQFPAILLVQWG